MKATVFCFLLISQIGLGQNSIYRVSLWEDGGAMATSSLAILVTYGWQDSLIRKRCPCDPSEVNFLDRPAIGNHDNTAGALTDVGLGLAITAPVLADGLHVGWNREFFEDMVVYSETLLIAGGLVAVVKTIIQRPIPRSYEGDPEIIGKSEGYRSFYSGHTAVTVAALSAGAMTAHFRNRSQVLPWVATVVLGMGVAVGRVAGGFHFFTDVLVGAAIGAATGVIIPALHRKTDSIPVLLVPADGGARFVFRILL